MTNLVVFPKAHKNRPAQSIEEMQNSINQIRIDQINDVVLMYSADIVGNLSQLGYNLTERGVQKTISLGVESIRAALFQSVGLDHPLQNIAQDLVQYETIKEIEYPEEEDDD